MNQAKFLPAIAALAVIALAVGTRPATATPVEINFGAMSPTNGGCATSTSANDSGLICANGRVFAGNGDTFTANGYAGAPGTSTPEALTLKPLASPPGPPVNSLEESGLGENAVGAMVCSDTFVAANCEIAGSTSVGVQATTGPITDFIVGSAQAGETFQPYIGTSLGTLMPFGPVLQMSNCVAGPAPETCIITGFSAQAVGVQNVGTVGNVLLVAVSEEMQTMNMPEPATLLLLGTALVGIGFARRRRA